MCWALSVLVTAHIWLVRLSRIFHLFFAPHHILSFAFRELYVRLIYELSCCWHTNTHSTENFSHLNSTHRKRRKIHVKIFLFAYGSCVLSALFPIFEMSESSKGFRILSLSKNFHLKILTIFLITHTWSQCSFPLFLFSQKFLKVWELFSIVLGNFSRIKKLLVITYLMHEAARCVLIEVFSWAVWD